ncbi:glycoside hydrolase family 9 protein [Chitinophaga skermanii]|nr:glycoside hydrolase family 9 protein [Chitinophaga skermanii]
MPTKNTWSAILLLMLSMPVFAQQGESISINQVGYYTQGPKICTVVEKVTATEFFIVNSITHDTVFNGRLSEGQVSKHSSLHTKTGDFSRLQGEGRFYVYVPGVGNSYLFNIGPRVLAPAAVSVLKGFYYQRVSIPLDSPFAGKWARKAGHPDDKVQIHPSAASAERPAGSTFSSSGGWYDAGDYNKYIVNSGITMGTLFNLYEDFPFYSSATQYNIPESFNGIPDVLDEAIYNLRWMLTMQDPNDGGVYHKLTNASFDGTVMPGVTTLPRYFVQKSTAATLDFVAVTAQAARILSKYASLKALGDSCLHAALFAYEWAEMHPNQVYNQDQMNQQYQPTISTGAYGDQHLEDERFWATAELLITTQHERYLEVIQQQFDQAVTIPTWSNVRTMGVLSILRYYPQRFKQLNKKFFALADQYVSGVPGNAFRTAMGLSTKEFNWGSNSNAANQGMILVAAYQLSGKQAYLDAALSNIDYLLGRNATGYCFVTGLGTKSPQHPHHRPSQADGIDAPVPGLLVGGPNPGMQDKCSYTFTEPERAYTDQWCSYASNEIAINWNAPIVYLLNAVEALQGKAGYIKNDTIK